MDSGDWKQLVQRSEESLIVRAGAVIRAASVVDRQLKMLLKERSDRKPDTLSKALQDAQEILEFEPAVSVLLQNAQQLLRTRNRIAHFAEIPSLQDCRTFIHVFADLSLRLRQIELSSGISSPETSQDVHFKKQKNWQNNDFWGMVWRFLQNPPKEIYLLKSSEPSRWFNDAKTSPDELQRVAAVVLAFSLVDSLLYHLNIEFRNSPNTRQFAYYSDTHGTDEEINPQYSQKGQVEFHALKFPGKIRFAARMGWISVSDAPLLLKAATLRNECAHEPVSPSQLETSASVDVFLIAAKQLATKREAAVNQRVVQPFLSERRQDYSQTLSSLRVLGEITSENKQKLYDNAKQILDNFEQRQEGAWTRFGEGLSPFEMPEDKRIFEQSEFWNKIKNEPALRALAQLTRGARPLPPSSKGSISADASSDWFGFIFAFPLAFFLLAFFVWLTSGFEKKPIPESDGGTDASVSSSEIRLTGTLVRVLGSSPEVENRSAQRLFDGNDTSGWCVSVDRKDRFVKFDAPGFLLTRIIVRGGWPYYSPRARASNPGSDGDMWRHSLIVSKVSVIAPGKTQAVYFNRETDRERSQTVDLNLTPGPVKIVMDKLDGGTQQSGRFGCWGDIEVYGVRER